MFYFMMLIGLLKILLNWWDIMCLSNVLYCFISMVYEGVIGVVDFVDMNCLEMFFFVLGLLCFSSGCFLLCSVNDFSGGFFFLYCSFLCYYMEMI